MKVRRDNPPSTAVTKRRFLTGAAGAAIGASLGRWGLASASEPQFDLIVIGGGNAGLPAAIFSAQRGARVLIVDSAPTLGGTLFFSGGRMSAAGTKLQKRMGIQDSPDLHFKDVMRLSRATANPELLRLAVEHAAPAFDWLMANGLQLADGVPVPRGMTHEAQNRARYVWARGGGMGILEVLQKVIDPLIAAGKIVVQTATEVTGLSLADNGAVNGVHARQEDGAEARFQGRSVLLAAGGYTSNSAMFEELEGVPDYSNVSNPFSQGMGITLGLAAGGFVRGGEHHLPTFGSIMVDNQVPALMLAGIKHYPPDRPPWEIWVNVNGDRFIREDVVSIHEKELALGRQPHERFWVVFDQAILAAAPPVVNRWSREEIVQAFDDEVSFVKADTLEQLAEAAGIKTSGLASTVRRYNAAQAGGADELGRKHMPLPLGEGPFYAIRIQSSQLIGFAGLAVDGQLRVLRTDGKPVPNLYAAGEVLGAGQLMGQCYFGGMMVTPALAFGRLLGRELIPVDV